MRDLNWVYEEKVIKGVSRKCEVLLGEIGVGVVCELGALKRWGDYGLGI